MGGGKIEVKIDGSNGYGNCDDNDDGTFVFE